MVWCSLLAYSKESGVLCPFTYVCKKERYGHVGYLQSLLIDDQLMRAAVQKMNSLTIGASFWLT